MKSARKTKAIFRKFKNAVYILATAEFTLEERHALFVECVEKANALRKKKGKRDVSGNPRDNDSPEVVKARSDRQAMAQSLFIDEAIKKYPLLFRGVKL